MIIQRAHPVEVSVPFLRERLAAGDLIARITRAVGIKPCTPCEQRKQRMNELVLFRPWEDER